MSNVVPLTCCCCGNGLRGRQWQNRDEGYGLCNDCIDYCRARVSNPAYGVEGVHYNVKENKNEAQ